MDNCDKIFPQTTPHALAYLWLEQQDNTGLTPTELFEKYEKAYIEIYEQYRATSTNL